MLSKILLFLLLLYVKNHTLGFHVSNDACGPIRIGLDCTPTSEIILNPEETTSFDRNIRTCACLVSPQCEELRVWIQCEAPNRSSRQYIIVPNRDDYQVSFTNDNVIVVADGTMDQVLSITNCKVVNSQLRRNKSPNDLETPIHEVKSHHWRLIVTGILMALPLLIGTPVDNAVNDLILIGGTHSKQFYTIQQQMTWAAALRFCEGRGLVLASTENSTENDIAYNFFRSSGWNDGYAGYWISAVDLYSKGSPYWIYSGQKLTYHRISDGNGFTETRRCVRNTHWNGGYGGQWIPGICNEDLEYPLCSYAPIQGHIRAKFFWDNTPPLSWLSENHGISNSQIFFNEKVVYIGTINSKTYYVVNEQMTWANALEFCESADTYLASTENENENRMLFDFFLRRDWNSTQSKPYWLSATDLHSPKKPYWLYSGKFLSYNRISLGNYFDETRRYIVNTHWNGGVGGQWIPMDDQYLAFPVCMASKILG